MTGIAVGQCGPLDAALDTVRTRAAAGQQEVEMWASTYIPHLYFVFAVDGFRYFTVTGPLIASRNIVSPKSLRCA